MKYPIALCAALTLFSTTVFAHVTANPDNGGAGKYFQTSFRISHGCDGSDTTRISITIPSGFVSIKPEFKPGWKVEIKKRKLDKPVPAGHGKMAEEEFSEIIWQGGPLPDSQYDEFGLLMKLPEDKAGQTVYFPVTQSCEKGESRWVEIPSEGQEWHDMKSPAPFVKITGEDPSDSQHHHAH